MIDIQRKTEYCVNCDQDVDYRIEVSPQVFEAEKVNDVHFVYNEFTAKCPLCGNEIYVGWINDYNVANRNKLIDDFIKNGRAKRK